MKNIENTKNVLILVGISGAGKTSFAINYLKENQNYLRISRDDIRRVLVGNLDGYHQRKDLKYVENIVTDIEWETAKTILEYDYSLIVDNTNLKLKYVYDFYVSYCVEKGINYKFKLFDISLEEAKKRVYFRENRDLRHWMVDDEEDILNHKSVSYIDKQFTDYQRIREYIETNYKDRINGKNKIS